MSYDEIKWP